MGYNAKPLEFLVNEIGKLDSRRNLTLAEECRLQALLDVLNVFLSQIVTVKGV